MTRMVTVMGWLAAAVVAAQWLVVAAQGPAQRTFATPEEAVKALISASASRKGQAKTDELIALFGPDAKELILSTDEATSRQNRQTFRAAARESWSLADEGTDRKVLIVGGENWPFPVPLVRTANGWRFDTAAGKDEVIARRIGHNELSAIAAARTYVAAQQQYAQQGHDGKAPGLFATKFASDPGKQNGLYWPSEPREPRSPLGDLVAQAAESGQQLGNTDRPKAPFHGYYFKILTSQGSSARGGAKSYVVKGEMSGGFALVAWPAQYDVTGVMTFIVNQDGVVHQKDLGPETAKTAAAMIRYDPDKSWSRVE